MRAQTGLNFASPVLDPEYVPQQVTPMHPATLGSSSESFDMNISALLWTVGEQSGMITSFLMKHKLPVFHKLHVEAIIDRAKQQHVEQFSSNSTSSSLIIYRILQPEYRYAEYVSSVRCFSNRRLLSRFRCGCHGLHLNTGRWVDTKGGKAVSGLPLDAHLTVMLDKSMPVFFSKPFLSETFSLTLNQMHVVLFSEGVFHVENLLYPGVKMHRNDRGLQ